MAYPARQLISFGRYLQIEEESVIKHEFLEGLVWAMAGGTLRHSAILVNLYALLRTLLRGKECRPFESNLRIRVKSTGLATYPDASIISGRARMDPDDPKNTTATNPTVLIEVLSRSTEKYDRGEKLDHYKKIPTLREVALVSTREQLIEVWRRFGRTWKRHEYRDVAALESVGCEVPLTEVYSDLPDEVD